MKIAYVLDDTLDRPDGVQQAVLATGEWMRSRGHDIHYIVGRTERQDIKNVHSLARGLSVKFNGNRMATPLPVSGKKIKQFLDAEKFDVLHIQMPYSPFFAGKVINLAPKSSKIIGTFHILPYSKINSIGTKQLGRILRKSLSRFDQFISVSEPASKFAKSTFGINSVVIPNPVDTNKFRSQDISVERGKIVFLGRLEERKGIIELLSAYHKLLENDPNMIKSTSLFIGGKGRLHDKVKAMILDFPRGSKIELLGFVPEEEKASLLASADVAVFPSISGESFGIVLVEAMASGSKIILAGNNPGYSSVFAEKSELLINPKDYELFATKIRWALGRSKDVDNCSAWLRNEYKKYDVKVVCGKLLELYST